MIVMPMKLPWRPEQSIYASEQFLAGVGDEYGWLAGFNEAKEMRCLLPYTIIRKAIFRMVRFRIETILAAPEMSCDEEKSFLNSAMAYFRSIGADMIIPASTNTIFRTYPDGATAAPYGSYVIDLTQSEEMLWSRLHAKHRNVIRNAMKQGVTIRSGLEYLRAVHSLIEETLKRSDLSFMSFVEFERFVRSLGEAVKLFVAEHQGFIQGCAVIPYSLHAGYYLYAGSSQQPLTGSMNLLVWEAMRQLRNVGVQRYDFVGARINPEKGTKQDGLRMFKERFGGTLRQGYIWKMGFNRIKYWVYCAAVRINRGGDIVDLERCKLDGIVQGHTSEQTLNHAAIRTT